MTSDIDLYSSHPEKYNEIQDFRLDYRGAIEATVNLSTKYLVRREKANLVDFCGGVGNVTKKIAQQVSVGKATIIDINEELLKIAQDSNIEADVVDTVHSDILKVELQKEFDLVLSVFAYHHVPDNEKKKYLEIALSGMKDDAIFVLTEIYLPNREITLQYYKKLLNEIPNKSQLLESFINETANSTDFEFKVTQEFARNQLNELGFKIVESVKIWPLDNTFEESVGTFVQVFRK